MSRQNEAAPVIIRRKRVVAGGGHHGGAWKVAYADFVTAMMAFFLMMWLLGATTEDQRRGLADYFDPTVTIRDISSGGEALLSGSDLNPRDRTDQADDPPVQTAESGVRTDTEIFNEVVDQLSGLGGESALMAQALRHVVTRITDEGLAIELFDLPGAPLFAPETEAPEPVLALLAGMLTEVLGLAANPLAIAGHVRSYSVVQVIDPRWPLSAGRAGRMRALLEANGLEPARIARLTGHADRRLAVANPMADRNNRLEITLLRRGL